MGSACSRKRGQLVHEDELYSVRFSKSGSFKWLLHTLSRSSSDVLRKAQRPGPGHCPSLVELCVARVREDISRYSDFSMLPRDLSQQIFNELVEWSYLTEESLEAFRDCALQDICLEEYPGVKDAWMEVVASQGQSLLSVDISCSDVTDSGLDVLKDCSKMQCLACNYCDQISEHGLKTLSGLSNLTSLSLKKCAAVTAEGAKAFAELVNLVNLDLERCPKIHGGLVHLKGLRKLETLNMRYCNCITDSDMKYLSDLTNLRELQLSCCKISDIGVFYLKGLSKLAHLNLEGCAVTAACLEAISGLASLIMLNLNRCGIYDEGCENLEGLVKLKVLNLGFNHITDACLVHLKELVSLECLNLDSCKIGDEGLLHLKGLLQLRSLELSDTEVRSNGLRHLSGLESVDVGGQPNALCIAIQQPDFALITTDSAIVLLHKSNITSTTKVNYTITSSTVSPDGTEAIVGAQDGKLRIYSISGDTLTEEAVLEKHRGAITTIHYSPDVSMFASADANREAVAWDRATREINLKNMLFHTARINCLAWSPDSRLVATGSIDTCAIVYDVDKPASSRITIKGAHLGGVHGLTFADNDRLVTAGEDACVRVWKLVQ